MIGNNRSMVQLGAESGQYALGDSGPERERLQAQAERLRTLSDRFLCDAGIVPGMHVLELGCGPGAFTLCLAEQIGAGGRILALEKSTVMLREAQEAVERHRIGNVRFMQCDINSANFDTLPPFDAIVGRLILTHLNDPVKTLRAAQPNLRPGGLMAFQEADFTMADSLLAGHREQIPLTWKVCHWLNLARSGSSMKRNLGLDLYHLFTRAGMPAPTIQLHTEVYGGALASRVRNTVRFMRDALGRLAELGISADEIGIETLEERLMTELAAADVVQARASIASAWSAKPL